MHILSEFYNLLLRQKHQKDRSIQLKKSLKASGKSTVDQDNNYSDFQNQN